MQVSVSTPAGLVAAEAGISFAERVRHEIDRVGPLEAYRALIAENDALIGQAMLDNGGEIVARRSIIHHEMVRDWASEQHRVSGYDKPFAVVALGGTGRLEVAPASDLDFGFLFDDSLEGNALLLELQRQLLHTPEFQETHGFWFEPMPFNLDDAPRLAEKQLNSFLDLHPIHDPTGLAERFRERIRATYDSFEHFLHVRGFWLGKWEKAAAQVESLESFDIKNDALRVFLAGVWTLAGKRFDHSHEVYQRLEDPRDLEAYRFLMRVRCFVHLRRPNPPQASFGGNHPEDLLQFDDYTSFGQMLGPDADEWTRFEFANDVRARLLAVRRRVARFTKTIIDRELKEGREAGAGSGIVYGMGGLSRAVPAADGTPEEKSRAALSVVLASQRYGVPIDPAELQSTFRHVSDWLVPVPELGALFYEERGSLATSLGFLAQLEGAEERLFPGHARFEASMDARVETERKLLRGALARQKIQALEEFVKEGRQKLARAVSPGRLTDVLREVDVAIEASLLDASHLAAVKLALKTKRLPLTPEDLSLRSDEKLPLGERYSSGMSEIPLDDYYEPYHTRGGFSEETARIARQLVLHRRAFKRLAETPNDEQQVREFARICANEEFLRALFVFTSADRAHWESQQHDPARWFNSRELYSKTMRCFGPAPVDPSERIRLLGCGDEEAQILQDFGEAFWGGEYRQYASVFASHLCHLNNPQLPGNPRAVLLSGGASPIIGVAARDYRGLAASITGALWRQRIHLRQAHLFSSMHYAIALDFFHVVGLGETTPVSALLRGIEEAIRLRQHIGEKSEDTLPPLKGRSTLHEWRPGEYRLEHETSEDARGLVYALAYKVFRHLRGNIFGLVAHAARGVAYVSVYHSLPPDLPLEEARRLVAAHFR
jgi:hypothetical protein